MIIFGSGMYGKRNRVDGCGRCDHCGAFGMMRSYDGRKYGHLYFIPLIPSGPPVRVLRECSKCNLGSHIPRDQISQLKRNTENNIEDALSARSQGRKEFVPSGDRESLHCGIFIANSVELMYCLEMDELVDYAVETLSAAKAGLESNVVQGSAYEFVGEPRDAEECYQDLVDNYDYIDFPVYLGEFYRRWNKLGPASNVYEKALRKWPNEVFFLEGLLDIYTQSKDYEAVCKTYERIFDLIPKLREDKKFSKPYLKACKRVKRDPVI